MEPKHTVKEQIASKILVRVPWRFCLDLCFGKVQYQLHWGIDSRDNPEECQSDSDQAHVLIGTCQVIF